MDDLQKELKKLRLVLDTQANIVIVTDGELLIDANKAFLDFFSVSSVEEFLKNNDCICDFFLQSEHGNYLQKVYPDGTTWHEVIVNESDNLHKAMIKDKNGQNRVFEVQANRLIDGEVDYGQVVVTFTDITTMEHQAILISNMEIPILEIKKDQALIPLMGILDSVKSQKLMEKLLIFIKEKAIKTAIVDIGSISVIDSAVAAHLIKISRATKLMGCTTILSGISPEVASSMVNLGISLEGILTTATLKDALKSIKSKDE